MDRKREREKNSLIKESIFRIRSKDFSFLMDKRGGGGGEKFED